MATIRVFLGCFISNKEKKMIKTYREGIAKACIVLPGHQLMIVRNDLGRSPGREREVWVQSPQPILCPCACCLIESLASVPSLPPCHAFPPNLIQARNLSGLLGLLTNTGGQEQSKLFSKRKDGRGTSDFFLSP